MHVSRKSRFTKAAIAGAILLCAHAGLLADEKAGPSEDGEEAIEEIVVRVYKSGDRIDINARYEELLRLRVKKDLTRMRVLEEEYEWRISESDVKSPSRIKWGYDARAELRMRRDTKITDLPIDDTKPATLFRFQF